MIIRTHQVMRIRSFMVGVMFMFVLLPKLLAAELTIAFSVDTPPYAMEKANSGIEIEIVRYELKTYNLMMQYFVIENHNYIGTDTY